MEPPEAPQIAASAARLPLELMQRAVARNVQLLDLEDIKRVLLACKGLHACLAEISDPEALGAWLGRRLGAQGFSIDGIGVSEMEAELEGLRERPGFSKSEDATLRAPRSAVAAAALLAWPRAAGLGPAQLTAALLAALRAAGAPVEVVEAARAAAAAPPPALPPQEQLALWARAVLADGRPSRLTAGAEPTAPERAAAAAFVEAARRALGPRALLLAPFAAAGGRAGLADAIAADALGRCCPVLKNEFAAHPQNTLGFGDLLWTLYEMDWFSMLRVTCGAAAARAGRTGACLRFVDAGREAGRAGDRNLCCKAAAAGGRLAAMEALGAFKNPTTRGGTFHALASNGRAEALRGFIARCTQLPRGATQAAAPPLAAAEAACEGGASGGSAGAGPSCLQQQPPGAEAAAEPAAAQSLQQQAQAPRRQEEEAGVPQPGGGAIHGSGGGSSGDDDCDDEGADESESCWETDSGDGGGSSGDGGSDDRGVRILTARALAEVCTQPRGADVLRALHEFDAWRAAPWRWCCRRERLGCGAAPAPNGAFRSAAMELPTSSGTDPEQESDMAASLVAALAQPACLSAHVRRAGDAAPHALLGAAREAEVMLRAAPELAPALAPLLQAVLRGAAEGLPACSRGGGSGGKGEKWRQALQAAARLAVRLRCAGSAAAVLEAARLTGELGCLAAPLTEAGGARGGGLTASLSEWLHALQPARSEAAAGGAAARGVAKHAAAGMEWAALEAGARRALGAWPKDEAEDSGEPMFYGTKQDKEWMLHTASMAWAVERAGRGVAVAGALYRARDRLQHPAPPGGTLVLLRAAAAAAWRGVHGADTVEAAALVAITLPVAGSPWLALAAQAPLERAGGPAALDFALPGPLDGDESDPLEGWVSQDEDEDEDEDG
ncbi:MAG: hypothetical protein J3K34DRAFT_518995 [Monoraphidium minutum]|nr:MAG: hypothetical protein J3K34DRAFT_518995 [Monoraphidium minutum]